MARAGQHVEQCFGNAEASHGGLLFQGHVNGSFHIHHETQAKQHAAQRIIPFPRNEDVVDRYIFAELDQLLPPSPDYQSAALWGLGGSGKTQIALEYAYRRSRDPACSVFWVHADNETTFTQDYKVIAKRLGLADGLNGPELLMAVRERIEASPCWLLILDNADNLAVFGVGRTQSGRDQGQDTEEKQSLYDFVPRGPAGTVLWTSRDKRIRGSLVGGRRAINVASMTEGEAKILLETVMCREIAEEESHNAMALLAELDLLPLAVSQAAAYMGRTAIPIGEYLSKLKRRIKRWQLFSKTEFDRHRRADVSNSVMQTWGISIEHIRQENQMAYNILHSLAFVDNQNIPLELVAKAAEITARPTRYEKTASAKSVCIKDQYEHQDEHQDDDNKVLAAIVLLQHFSFLRPRTSDERYGAYEMHKLVQEATQYSLSQEDRRTDQWHFSEVALHAATSLFPERRRELWGECERYLRHAQLAAGWAGLCRGGVEAAALLTRVSDYLYDRGRWREREPVDLRAYEYRRELLGDKHPDTIWSMASLAATYHNQGRYEEAEKNYMEVLALQRDVLGDKHPDTIRSMAELATTYYTQGSMASLATTYHAQGRYKEVEKILVEVLVLRRDVLGDKHPNTLQAMHDRALTWNSRQRRPKAELLKALPFYRDIHSTIESQPKILSRFDVLHYLGVNIHHPHIARPSGLGSLLAIWNQLAGHGNKQIRELKNENTNLKNEVNNLKKQVVDLEVSVGKHQQQGITTQDKEGIKEPTRFDGSEPNKYIRYFDFMLWKRAITRAWADQPDAFRTEKEKIYYNLSSFFSMGIDAWEFKTGEQLLDHLTEKYGKRE
ncbi:NB-ARC domain and tetratricopeptide repeat-containing NOD-like receptor [Podospora pseudoanserina]|uniref:NB-ARC domain and tetratricopeptide repeat-containing NOD-like receptor n=1 Tax=Podospora pseudoanserina TaxID=2609844 RepID=A0ABR0IEZ0_9PEZI|nr:NB-ARC domain and tetratricopeptide repeat-containing NOD-like receptor [Podospora pseudoanserina]